MGDKLNCIELYLNRLNWRQILIDVDRVTDKDTARDGNRDRDTNANEDRFQ